MLDKLYQSRKLRCVAVGLCGVVAWLGTVGINHADMSIVFGILGVLGLVIAIEIGVAIVVMSLSEL